MSSKTDTNAVAELLGTNTTGNTNASAPPAQPTKKKFGTTTAAKIEEAPEKKLPFTSTITGENKRRMASYQATKPGGAQTTDIFNQALKMFFDANKQWADVDSEGK